MMAFDTFERISKAQRRATAYGLFNIGYGQCWFAGSALMGLLYDQSLPALIGVSVALQLVAVITLVLVNRRRAVLTASAW